ncbi:MAG TPA: hypothetical protein VFA53_07870 [Xanthobacteraceae bacterium]|nr:hypothetical protein [Xanthobacteraceae bacterium]
MNRTFRIAFLSAAFAAGAGGLVFAQSASTIGSTGASVTPGSSSATGGTAGSAAAGGTSASTLGTGGTSTSPTESSSTIGSAGSAAGGTKDTSSTKIHGNENKLHAMSKARAQDKGTWSKSMTKTKVHKREVASETKSMAHEPGGKPVKSITGVDSAY